MINFLLYSVRDIMKINIILKNVLSCILFIQLWRTWSHFYGYFICYFFFSHKGQSKPILFYSKCITNIVLNHGHFNLTSVLHPLWLNLLYFTGVVHFAHFSHKREICHVYVQKCAKMNPPAMKCKVRKLQYYISNIFRVKSDWFCLSCTYEKRKTDQITI